MHGKNLIIIISVPEDFNLEKTVCNHGFFMMAPNNWEDSTKTLVRPLRLANHDETSVTASIYHLPNTNFLSVTLEFDSHHHSIVELSSDDRQFIKSQVERMLHISKEDERAVKDFHMVNPTAKRIGFARIFRSPTLFEDMVKSLLLSNTIWNRTLDMAEDLCISQHKLVCCSTSGKKRKRCCCKCTRGNFPTPKEITSLDLKILQHDCKLGYRAKTILKLAHTIQNGGLKLEDISVSHDAATCYARLLRIDGFGPFVAANVMMCIGFYQYIPIDSETSKHLKEVHGKPGLKDKKAIAGEVAQIYDKFAPFQCLVYWMERVEFYEKRLGKLSALPRSSYGTVSSTFIRFLQNKSHKN